MTLEWQLDGDRQDSGDPSVAAQPARRSLLSLLVAAGAAPEDDLRRAFEEAMERGVRPGEIVLERGWLDADGLARLIASQWGLPFLACEAAHRDPAAPLSAERERSIGGSVIGSLGGGRLVAVAEPTAERLSTFRALLGSSTQFAVATEACLLRLHGEAEGAAPAPVPVEPAAHEDERADAEELRTESLVAGLELATEGLTAARERIEKLADARRAAAQLVGDLQRRLAEIDEERTREQQQSRQLLAELEVERARTSAFRLRLAELLAEFER